MNQLINQVLLFIRKHELITPGSTIIIGLSGGPDSVFLAYALHQLQSQLQCTLIAAHLNHEWRPEAGEDALFCQNLAAQLGIEFVLQTASELTVKNRGGSIEEYGRTLRRTFFESVRIRYNAQAIALGHHADDQHETFFIRLLRGAGLEGLAGIRAHHGLYIRPLLALSKKDILQYLTERSIAYCIDSTNLSDNFLRNRIRNHLIPMLNDLDNRFEKNISRTIDLLQQTDDFIDHTSRALYVTLVTNQALDIAGFLEQHSLMQYAILIQWFAECGAPFVPSHALIKEIIRFFLNTKSSEHTVHPEWKLIKKSGTATIAFI